MSSISNRNQLKQYCLVKLGSPVIEINVSDEQIENRIDDAVDFFVDYGYNYQEHKYLPIKISQLDIDNGYITVPEELLAVTRILPINNPSINSTSYLFDIQYHLTANDLYNTALTGDVSSYYITKQHIATISDLFNARSQHEIRRYTDKLYFKLNTEQRIHVDGFIVLECTTPIDLNSRFWGDRLIRNYATALIQRQWANNMSKFENVLLPGGVKLNASQLYERAQTEIDKIEQDAVFQYSEPVSFEMG